MKELGTRGVWHRPVRQRGRAQGRTASASVANVAARPAPSWRLRSSARGLAADSKAPIAALWRWRPSASVRPSDSAVRAAASWRGCLLAASDNVTTLWLLRSSASASATGSLARRHSGCPRAQCRRGSRPEGQREVRMSPGCARLWHQKILATLPLVGVACPQESSQRTARPSSQPRVDGAPRQA